MTGARIGSKRVPGSTYAALLHAGGPLVLPKTSEDAVPIALRASAPNPWTQVRLLWYPRDHVLFRSPGTYIRLPDGVAADIEAARPLGAGDGPIVPWVPLGVAFAAVVALLLLAVRGPARPAPKPVAAP